MAPPTDEYFKALEQSKIHHALNKTFSGKLFRPHAPFVKQLIDRLGCQSVLDYGCGKGLQYEWRCDVAKVPIPLGMTIEEFWGVPVTKYDPAWPPFAAEPQGKFDLVICTHTLATIPLSDLAWVVDRLYSFANKAIFIAEKIGPAKKVLYHPEKRPVGWTAQQWMVAVKREKAIEVILSVREELAEGPRITRYTI